jgi:hypothetical protein
VLSPSRFRALRTLLAVFAAVGVLATPLRLWADCPMLGPESEQAAHVHGTHGVAVSLGEHTAHEAHARGATVVESPDAGSEQLPTQDVCFDLAHCVVTGPVSAAERIEVAVSSPGEPGSAPALAFSDAARTLEPPPPKRS